MWSAASESRWGEPRHSALGFRSGGFAGPFHLPGTRHSALVPEDSPVLSISPTLGTRLSFRRIRRSLQSPMGSCASHRHSQRRGPLARHAPSPPKAVRDVDGSHRESNEELGPIATLPQACVAGKACCREYVHVHRPCSDVYSREAIGSHGLKRACELRAHQLRMRPVAR